VQSGCKEKKEKTNKQTEQETEEQKKNSNVVNAVYRYIVKEERRSFLLQGVAACRKAHQTKGRKKG